ncbi:MAG: hypothetical protein ACRDRD_21905, partial [Pseudonocardiaceae bacterium]
MTGPPCNCDRVTSGTHAVSCARLIWVRDLAARGCSRPNTYGRLEEDGPVILGHARPPRDGVVAELRMWVVYRPAPPYPSSYQAREFAVGAHSTLTGRYAVGGLELVRGYLSEHLQLTRLDRAPDD